MLFVRNAERPEVIMLSERLRTRRNEKAVPGGHVGMGPEKALLGNVSTVKVEATVHKECGSGPPVFVLFSI